MRAALVIAGAVWAGALLWSRQVQAAPIAPQVDAVGFGWDAFAGVVDTAGSSWDAFGSVAEVWDTVQSEVANMMSSVDSALQDRNVQAFLTLIRTGEGTADPLGYSRLFGGRQFAGFADHPRQRIPFGSTYSTAAGAYQILARTWDEIAAQYSLPDFSPASQDRAAVGLIKRRGALGDVLAGRFESAIAKCNREWASLPGSPYGQPTLTLAAAQTVLQQQGGTFAA